MNESPSHIRNHKFNPAIRAALERAIERKYRVRLIYADGRCSKPVYLDWRNEIEISMGSRKVPRPWFLPRSHNGLIIDVALANKSEAGRSIVDRATRESFSFEHVFLGMDELGQCSVNGDDGTTWVVFEDHSTWFTRIDADGTRKPIDADVHPSIFLENEYFAGKITGLGCYHLRQAIKACRKWEALRVSNPDVFSKLGNDLRLGILGNLPTL
jgi:hypothetical protein